MAKLYSEVLCVGVGMSGVCLGVQLQRKFGFTDIHFYDRNASYSGTWLVNRYPGESFKSVPAHPYVDYRLGVAW